MAPSISWMRICVAALVAPVALADTERFPLSGGVASGVNVRLWVSNLEQGVHVDFLTPDRRTAAAWMFDTANKVVERSSNFTTGVSTWGGWPSVFDNLAQPFEIDFLKTSAGVVVTVNGIRLPSFDSPVDTDNLMVHVTVSTDADKLVTLTRPVCSQKCHPTECKAEDGSSTCSSGMCYARLAMVDPTFATCSDSTDTGVMDGEDMVCCTGHPQHVNIATAAVDAWVRISSTADEMREICTHYNANPDTCAELAHTNLRIEGIFMNNNTLKLWAPYLLTKSAVDQYAYLPPFVAYYKDPETRFMNLNTNTMKDLVVDATHGFVKGYVTTDGPAAEADVPQYWFVHMMTSLQGVNRWYAWFADRWDFTKNQNPDVCSFPDFNGTVYVVFSDEEIPSTTCVDDMDWTDTDGHVCANFTQGNWCSWNGEPTDAYKVATGHDKFSGNTTNAGDCVVDWNPAWACCTCGGGYHDTPDEAPASAQLMFQ